MFFNSAATVKYVFSKTYEKFGYRLNHMVAGHIIWHHNNKCMAMQNTMGPRMHPCLTSEVFEILGNSIFHFVSVIK